MTPRPRLLCLHACMVGQAHVLESDWSLHGHGVQVLLVMAREYPPAWRPDYARMRLKTDLEDTLGCKVHHVMGGGDRP